MKTVLCRERWLFQSAETLSFAGITRSFEYNNRLQPTLIAAASPTATLLDLGYDFNPGANNGAVRQITNNLNNDRTQTFTYDHLGRIQTAQSQATSGAHDWGLAFSYDPWGNLLEQQVTQGDDVPMLSVTVNNKNQITDSGFAYDASGNLTADGLNTYSYDAENRLSVRSLAGGTTTRHIFSGRKVMVRLRSPQVAEYVNGALNREYIYTSASLSAGSGSQLLATVWSGGSVNYHHHDQLSIRVNSRGDTGAVLGQLGHFPGVYPERSRRRESWYASGTGTKWKFTSYERDSESTLDYAMFRYDNTRLGRFMTPDPLAGSLLDPQSLNRYAYVRNDPINLIDPLGLRENLVIPPGWPPSSNRYRGGHPRPPVQAQRRVTDPI